MATDTTPDRKELLNVRGGRFIGRVKRVTIPGKSPFITAEVTTLLSDFEYNGLVKAVSAGKKPYINISLQVAEMASDEDLLRRLRSFVVQVEAAADQEAIKRAQM